MDRIILEKVIVNGKKRIVMTKNISGVDKSKEAVLRVMGSGWEFEETNKKKEAI